MEGKLLTRYHGGGGPLGASDARPIDDIRGSADYRREMVRVTTMRALTQTARWHRRNGYRISRVMLASNLSLKTLDSRGTLIHEEEGNQPIVTTVNGKRYQVRGANDKTLLRMLREDIGLTGTRKAARGRVRCVHRVSRAASR